MEDKTLITCYKIYEELDLKKIARYFKLTGLVKDSPVIPIKPNHIGQILKVENKDKYVWLYKFGSVCLINFEEWETFRFFRYLESISGKKVNYDLLSFYNERQIISAGAQYKDNNHLIQIAGLYANILVKSVELRVIEETIKNIFDQAERFLFDLHSGVPNIKSKSLRRINMNIIKLQLKMIKDLKVLDCPRKYRDELKLKDLYDQTMKYYEINTRFEGIQSKIDDLNKVVSPYQKLGFSWRENRLLVLEIILLALFPILHFTSKIMPKLTPIIKNFLFGAPH